MPEKSSQITSLNNKKKEAIIYAKEGQKTYFDDLFSLIIF